jgi:hypothetical protein
MTTSNIKSGRATVLYDFCGVGYLVNTSLCAECWQAKKPTHFGVARADTCCLTLFQCSLAVAWFVLAVVLTSANSNLMGSKVSTTVAATTAVSSSVTFIGDEEFYRAFPSVLREPLDTFNVYVVHVIYNDELFKFQVDGATTGARLARRTLFEAGCQRLALSLMLASRGRVWPFST